MCRRIISTALLVGVWAPAFLAASAVGQPVAPPAPGIGRVGNAATPGRDLILTPTVPPESVRAIAGLPERAPAEVLTRERAYSLAIVRARGRGVTFAESLDPEALAEQARRHGVADFARFRKEFLDGRAEGGGVFRDPGGAYLAILRRLQVIDDARRHLAALENLRNLVRELLQGESAGLSQLDADLLDRTLVQGRGRLSEEIAAFRDALDRWKVALGLSPHAAAIPDPGGIAAFRGIFTELDRWSMRPDRDLAQLPRIIGRLPEPGDAVVRGRPILVAIEEAPGRMEELLTDAARLAMANRPGTDRAAGGAGASGQADAALELRVRHRVRRLLESRRAYRDAKRGCELAIRLRDQAFERLFDPSIREAAPARRTPAISGVIADQRALQEAQDRLVTLWTSFRTERLALYRDLGTLPHESWEAFYADLSAVAVDVAPEAGPPPAVPAPPAPPVPPPGPPAR